MARKQTTIVHVNLRIREDLRRRLESSAKKREVSLNSEISSRLEQSFEQQHNRSNSEIVEDMKNIWARYGEGLHALNQQGDLLRAAEVLVSKIEQLPLAPINQQEIEAATAKVKQIAKMIDTEAALQMRRMHTTGEDV